MDFLRSVRRVLLQVLLMLMLMLLLRRYRSLLVGVVVIVVVVADFLPFLLLIEQLPQSLPHFVVIPGHRGHRRGAALTEDLAVTALAGRGPGARRGSGAGLGAVRSAGFVVAKRGRILLIFGARGIAFVLLKRRRDFSFLHRFCRRLHLNINNIGMIQWCLVITYNSHCYNTFTCEIQCLTNDFSRGIMFLLPQNPGYHVQGGTVTCVLCGFWVKCFILIVMVKMIDPWAHF